MNYTYITLFDQIIINFSHYLIHLIKDPFITGSSTTHYPTTHELKPILLITHLSHDLLHISLLYINSSPLTKWWTEKQKGGNNILKKIHTKLEQRWSEAPGLEYLHRDCAFALFCTPAAFVRFRTVVIVVPCSLLSIIVLGIDVLSSPCRLTLNPVAPHHDPMLSR